MGIRSALIIALSILAVPASAQITPNVTPLPPSLMDQVVDDASRGVITWQDFCQNLPTYHQNSDVNYQPGVDAYGRPVVPADLPNQPSLNLPQQYRVFLTTDQIGKLGIAIPGVPVKADTFIGQVSLTGDGKIMFNGKPVSTDQVYTVCNRMPLN